MSSGKSVEGSTYQGSDGNFEVVWPLAKSTGKVVRMNPRFKDRSAKRLGFIWDHMFRGDEMFELVQAGFAEHYPGSSFAPHGAFGNIHGHDEPAVLAALPARLREEQVDAVVVAVGA